MSRVTNDSNFEDFQPVIFTTFTLSDCRGKRSRRWRASAIKH